MFITDECFRIHPNNSCANIVGEAIVNADYTEDRSAYVFPVVDDYDPLEEAGSIGQAMLAQLEEGS